MKSREGSEERLDYVFAIKMVVQEYLGKGKKLREKPVIVVTGKLSGMFWKFMVLAVNY